MNYDELVAALRCANDGKLPCDNKECPYWVDQWHGIGLCNILKKHADAADAIEALQAQLPKRGEWVKGTDGLYHCSKCGKTAPYLDAFDGVIQYWEPLFFCNNCGADMRAKMEVQE